jgi:hypothetical protein
MVERRRWRGPGTELAVRVERISMAALSHVTEIEAAVEELPPQKLGGFATGFEACGGTRFEAPHAARGSRSPTTLDSRRASSVATTTAGSRLSSGKPSRVYYGRR